MRGYEAPWSDDSHFVFVLPFVVRTSVNTVSLPLNQALGKVLKVMVFYFLSGLNPAFEASVINSNMDKMYIDAAFCTP